MSEGIIALEKPIFSTDGNQTGSKINTYQLAPDSGQDVPLGGMEGKKQKIIIKNPKYGPDKTREVSETLSYISKEYKSKEKVIETIMIYDALRKKGLPVPPTTRYFEENGHHYLLMTDMTHGGKSVVWGLSDDMTSENQNSIDKMEIKSADLTDIRNLSREWAKTATTASLHPLESNYHLRKNLETGKFDIIILDVDSRIINPAYPVNNIDETTYFMMDIETAMRRRGMTTLPTW